VNLGRETKMHVISGSRRKIKTKIFSWKAQRFILKRGVRDLRQDKTLGTRFQAEGEPVSSRCEAEHDFRLRISGRSRI